MTDAWSEDVLGHPYRSRTLELTPDDEGDVAATLVRRGATPRVGASRAVLYLHGWSDYFFQTELADFWDGIGAAFYALDLRKYGRSLRPHQTPGYISELSEYDEDIAAALAAMRADVGSSVSIMLMGHSTGGLVAALWADRHPGTARGLVLNSPWLDLTRSSLLRSISTSVVRQMAWFQPKATLPNVDSGFYGRTLEERPDATWSIDHRWRPVPSFPIRPGWLRAIVDGHAHIARGLAVDCPVLVLLSDRSHFSPRWSEEMRCADVVLDVDAIAATTHRLGPVVTTARIPGGIHDLALSAPRPRARYYEEILRWTAAYGWSS